MNSNSFRSSRISCCVVGCSNSYINTDSSIKFYSFPNRPYESQRRQAWIQSVRKITEDGKPWLPKKTDRICSAHFIGNAKSSIAADPSYNPTIFPKEYRKQNDVDGSVRAKRRFERSQKIQKRKSTDACCESSIKRANTHESHNKIHINTTDFVQETNMSQDVSCQVNFVHSDESFVFVCDFDDKNVGVQVNIIRLPHIGNYSDKCVGNNDDIKCRGFHGSASINSDKEMNSLCGVTLSVFALMLSFLSAEHGNEKLPKKNQLTLFLMKLKLGISYRALAVLFNVHCSTVSRIFLATLNEVAQKMINFIFWPSRKVINETMPKAFRLHYQNCRVIIDCTEIAIEQPNSVENRIYTYSHYKSKFTSKFLIGIAPNGFISFISKCYGGRSSDIFITNDSGILDLLEPGDLVLADKGFPGISCGEDVVVVMPPFVHNGLLTEEEIEHTYSIASVRIHVERSIQRVKIYNILQKIPENLFSYVDDIVLMCCVLTNLQAPIIKDEYD